MPAAMTSPMEPSLQATGLRTTEAFCRRSATYSLPMHSPVSVNLLTREALEGKG